MTESKVGVKERGRTLARVKEERNAERRRRKSRRTEERMMKRNGKKASGAFD